MMTLRETMENLIKVNSYLQDVTVTYECDKCKDTGWIEEEIDGYVYAKECECAIRKRQMHRQEKHIQESGLQRVLDTKTFVTFSTEGAAEQNLFYAAKMYCEEYKSYWWYIAGQSGCGKTHLTTAICVELINKGIPVYYMQWKDESTKLKGLINDAKYSEMMKHLKTVEVLYVDDLFKGGASEAHLRLAFEIINARYNAQLPTLFSSELNLGEIAKLDMAIAGRINEMANKYALNVKSIENKRIGA